MQGQHRDLHDASGSFHTRPTLLRLPALHQDFTDETKQPDEKPPTGKLLFIAGSAQVNARSRQKNPARVQLMAWLALVPLIALLLLGMQGFVQQAARDCPASRGAQSCFGLSIFPSMSGLQVIMPTPSLPPPTPTATPRPAPSGPTIPAIPNDVPANVHDFLVIAMPYAVQAHQGLSWPTSVILAQWGLEHGWHVPDYTGYNWGNTSYAPGCPLVGGINVPGSPSHFCRAPNPAEGLREYLYAARLDYYTAVAPAARQGGANAAAAALGRSPWDAGHYTNIGQPGSSLLTIMRNFNFYRFDANS